MRISDWSSGVCSSDLARRAFGAADFLEFPFHRHLVDAVVRQREEQRDAVREIMERMFERFALARACDCGRIFDAPVRGHRLAGPCRACLAGRIVTAGEDEVEAGGAGLREFVPEIGREWCGE